MTKIKNNNDFIICIRTNTKNLFYLQELFIKHLSTEALKESNGKKLEYNHLANYVHKTDKLDFLGEILPKKITVLEFKRRLQQQKQGSASSSSSEDSEASSSDVSSEDESEEDKSEEQ